MVNTLLSWMEKYMVLYDKYGAAVILPLIIGLILLVLGWIKEKADDYHKLRMLLLCKKFYGGHEKSKNKRVFLEESVRRLLLDLLAALNADRTYILEYTNGVYNVSGLPWSRVSMTYEICNSGIKPFIGYFQNFPSSVFWHISTALEKKIPLYYNDMYGVKNIDVTHYEISVQKDYKSFSCFGLYDREEAPYGAVCVEWKNLHRVSKEDLDMLQKFAVKIEMVFESEENNEIESAEDFLRMQKKARKKGLLSWKR